MYMYLIVGTGLGWIDKYSTQDKYGTAYKTVELDHFKNIITVDDIRW